MYLIIIETQIQTQIQIGKNNWNSETYRKVLILWTLNHIDLFFTSKFFLLDIKPYGKFAVRTLRNHTGFFQDVRNQIS